MEKNNKDEVEETKIVSENEIREYYNSKYPQPSFISFFVGMVFFILCLANLYLVKIGTNNVLIVINFIVVFFAAKSTVSFVRRSWDFYDFNRGAERFFREKGR